jgi:uncharacterized membrane protein YhaH (DUF805 family)
MGEAVDDMLRPLRRYADFSGRASRREYWLFTLFSWSLVLVVGGVGTLLGWEPLDAAGEWKVLPQGQAPLVDMVVSGVLLLLLAGLLIPTLAVQVRRFHDRATSAWMLLWHIVPYIGSLVVLIATIRAGTVGTNRYGPDPTDPLDEYGFVIGTRDNAARDWS